jgi:thioredoxin
MTRCMKMDVYTLILTLHALVDHFSDVIIVVFWAPWCGPCRMLKPVLEEMEAEYSSKIKVVQLNTDEHQAAATEFGVRSIPTTMLFKVVSARPPSSRDMHAAPQKLLSIPP